MSLAAECLLCFGSQASPDVETGPSQMYVSLVSLSMDAWAQADVSARCWTNAMFVEKKVGNIIFMCSVLLNCLFFFSGVGRRMFFTL